MTSTPPLAQRTLLTGNLAGIGCMVAWAAGFPAAEALLVDWDPVPLVLARFGVALCLLVPLWLAFDGVAALARAPWWRGLVVGGLGFGGGAYCILMSQAYTDPVTVAIFAAATPLCATVVDWLWLRRGFSAGFLIGLAAAVIGGIVATGGGVPGSLGLGALFAILSGLAFSWGSLMTLRDLGDTSVLGRTTLTAIGAFAALALAMALTWALGQSQFPSAAILVRDSGLVAVYGLVAFALSQLLWVTAARALGVAVASFHINIAPFYTMLILLALGQAWSWPQAIGAGIVAVGVVMAQR